MLQVSANFLENCVENNSIRQFIHSTMGSGKSTVLLMIRTKEPENLSTFLCHLNRLLQRNRWKTGHRNARYK